MDLRLTLDKKFSDLVIATRDRNFRVHKVIMCGRSGVIASIIAKNPGISQICIDDFDSDTVARMLDSMYRGDYTTGVHRLSEPAGEASNEVCTGASESLLCLGFATGLTAMASVREPAMQRPNPNTIPEALFSGQRPIGAAYIHARMALIADDYELPTLHRIALERLNKEWTQNFDLRSYIMMLRDAVELDLLDIIKEGLVEAAVNNFAVLMKSDDFNDIELPSDFTMRLLREFGKRQGSQSHQSYIEGADPMLHGMLPWRD